jgi:hypothetical protein
MRMSYMAPGGAKKPTSTYRLPRRARRPRLLSPGGAR